MSDLTFEQIKPVLEQLIEHMPAAEVNRLRDWLGVQSVPTGVEPASAHWGQNLLALIDSMDLKVTETGWDNQDPETWVRDYRRTQTSRRNPGWMGKSEPMCPPA